MFGLDIKIIVALISLFGVIILPFLKILAQKLSTVKTIDEEAEISRNVNAEIANLKHEYGAMRVFINQYHNGGKFYSGASRQKVSMTFESYNENYTHSVLPKFQEIPVTYFSSMVYDLNKDGKVYQDSIESIKDTSFRRILKEEDVYSHYAFAIYKDIWYFRWHPLFFARKKVMIGSVHIYFGEEVELAEIDVISMESRAKKIGENLK